MLNDATKVRSSSAKESRSGQGYSQGLIGLSLSLSLYSPFYIEHKCYYSPGQRCGPTTMALSMREQLREASGAVSATCYSLHLLDRSLNHVCWPH